MRLTVEWPLLINDATVVCAPVLRVLHVRLRLIDFLSLFDRLNAALTKNEYEIGVASELAVMPTPFARNAADVLGRPCPAIKGVT